MGRRAQSSGATASSAGILRDNRLQRTSFGGFPADLAPHNEAEAYTIQDVLHEQLTAAGWGTVVGWKIGCTTAVMQAYLKIPNPCAGGIFEPTVWQDGATLERARFAADGRVGVECEIAVQLTRDLAPLPGETTVSVGAAAGAVGACLAAIEVVEDRYQDYSSLDAPTLIADDFFGAGCVLGAPHAGFDPRRLRDVTARMRINGREVGSGVGTDVLEEPLSALAWLADTLRSRGRVLRAGEFMLLGSLVQTHWITPGDDVEIENAPLGVVRMRLR